MKFLFPRNFTSYLLVASVVLLGSAGCLLKQPPAKTVSFGFAPEIIRKAIPNNQRILAVRLFEAAPTCEQSEFSYRLSELSWESDYYHTFSQPPAALLTYKARQWLSGSGLFQSVAIPGLAPSGCWNLQGFLTRLYGDFRNPEKPEAVISMRFSFFSPNAEAASKPLFNRAYEARIPFSSRTPSALMEGWDRGVEQIFRRMTEDVRQSLPPVTKSAG